MSYKAIITPIVNVRDHSNANALKLGTACGCQVVVGMDTKEGTLGVFFGEGGALSHDMCCENNLYRHAELNRDNTAKAGFFEDNRRIKTMKLRGEKSEGFWTELKVLEWTGIDTSTLEQGFEFDQLNGRPICEKYYSEATVKAMRKNKQGKPGKKKRRPLESVFETFKKHFDTTHLGRAIHTIPGGAVLQISEKCHGTSGRTGYLEEEIQLGWFKTWWNKHFPMKFETKQWSYVSGSRNVIYDPHKDIVDGYYKGTTFREEIHNDIKRRGLHKGETLYYEIVGYNEKGAAIMGTAKADNKDLKDVVKQYGKQFHWSYGCNTSGDFMPFKILLYRITRTTPDGYQIEVPYAQMVTRAAELGIEVVPNLKEPFIYDGDKEALIKLCDELIKGSSVLDNRHIKEGVVVRVEAPNKEIFLKHKGFEFCVIENGMKANKDYVDTEEIS